MTDRMARMFVHVDAPHFYAGLVIGRKTPTSTVSVLEAAPILRWSLGKSWIWLKPYFERKGWRYSMRPDPASLLGPNEVDPKSAAPARAERAGRADNEPGPGRKD